MRKLTVRSFRNDLFAGLQDEREKLGLRGLLPAGVVPLGVQLDNLMEQLRSKTSDIEKYNYLATIQVRCCTS